jgi:hypothetical protein
MNAGMGINNGCSEEFAELCALSTSGELTAEEMELLEQHLPVCTPCRALVQQYTTLTTIAMAKLAAETATEADVPFGQNENRAARQFITALRTQPTLRSRGRSPLPSVATPREGRTNTKRLAMVLAMAACLLLCIGGGVEIGRKMEVRSPQRVPLVAALNKGAVPDSENTRIEVELKAARASLDRVTTQSADLEKKLKRLTSTKESLSAQIDSLTQNNSVVSASLIAATQQRDELQRQLNDATASLVLTKEELNQVLRDRQGAQARLASLETEINDLQSELAATSRSAGSDEQFLAADRDIRELMGARQLYIADVFDVQIDGERSKPFGRVFYTRGKSLIFYAFDLEKQSGYRETKTFQAWGKSDGTSAKPVSIGVFYMDSEQNRRWVVKSDNPEILAQINSVFVTVEPRGGSQKPSGKPFLEAYLHTLPPNHP